MRDMLPICGFVAIALVGAYVADSGSAAAVSIFALVVAIFIAATSRDWL